MKRIFLLAFMITNIFITNAQVIDGKVLTVYTAKYDSLNNNTILVDSVNWDDPAYELPLGFPFQYFGTNVTDLFASDMFSFDGALFTKDLNSSTNTDIIGLAVDLANTRFDGHLTNPNSSISYETDTVNGKLVTKIQYDHVGFFDDTTGMDYLNFQTWLYEKDSALEYRIGKSSIDTNMFSTYFVGSGPAFVYCKNLDINNQAWDKMYAVVSLSPALADSLNLADVMVDGFSGLASFPDSGTVIRLAPAKINVAINQTQLNENISINSIVDNNLLVNFKSYNNEYHVSVFDTKGNMIIRKALPNTNNSIDCSNLSNGNYIVCIANNNEKVFYKIVKR